MASASGLSTSEKRDPFLPKHFGKYFAQESFLMQWLVGRRTWVDPIGHHYVSHNFPWPRAVEEFKCTQQRRPYDGLWKRDVTDLLIEKMSLFCCSENRNQESLLNIALWAQNDSCSMLSAREGDSSKLLKISLVAFSWCLASIQSFTLEFWEAFWLISFFEEGWPTLDTWNQSNRAVSGTFLSMWPRLVIPGLHTRFRA